MLTEINRNIKKKNLKGISIKLFVYVHLGFLVKRFDH